MSRTKRPLKFTLTIEAENDAFLDYPQGEVARILTDAALMILAGETSRTLRDANGNTVGQYGFSRAL